MATERLPMRKMREILRLKWLDGRRHRHIGRALGVSVGKVSAVVPEGRRNRPSSCRPSVDRLSLSQAAHSISP
jgi:hypothetical protein